MTADAATRVGALDFGTNSTRLLVAEVGPDGEVVTLERRMTITRLGQGVDADRRLHPDAIARNLDAARAYRELLDELGATRVRAAATSAARDAVNREELFGAIEEVLGVRPELLDGAEEGRLAFDGATVGLTPDTSPPPYLVVDIGGGSTEFVFGAPGEGVLGVVSTEMGCVRLTEQYLRSDPPAPDELAAALSVVRVHLDDVELAIPRLREAGTVIGVAGTVSTVAAVEQGLAEYDRDKIHHFRLTRAAVEDVFRTLATEPAADRRHNPGLEPGRVDVIVGGTLILAAVMRHLELDEVLVSESDILDGLARSLVS
jgi:exopolyphosphatase / guanosine-5'-triphosphate,3'-diphosphate pyrophosphatase